MHNICTQFAPVGIYYLGHSGLRSFNNNGILNGAIVPNSHDASSVMVLSHSTDSSFHRILCAVNIKGPYDALIQRLS